MVAADGDPDLRVQTRSIMESIEMEVAPRVAHDLDQALDVSVQAG